MKKPDRFSGSARSGSLVMAVGVAVVVLMVITVSAVPAVGSDVNGVEEKKIKINRSEIVNVDGVDIVCYYPTYEEFLSYNDAYYRFLQEEFGKDVADEMLEDLYEDATTEKDEIQGKDLRYWLQIVTHDGMSIEFLPYIWEIPNVDTDERGIINAVFVDADQSDVITRLESKGWESALGSTEWNFNDGDWDSSTAPDDQLKKGINLTYRHHLLLFEDNSGDYIVLGSGHVDQTVLGPPWHVLVSTQDTEDELRNDLAEHFIREQDMDNAGWCIPTDDGLAPIFGLDWVNPCVIYDTNGTPSIQKDEAVNALADYLIHGTIDKATAVAVLNCYFFP